MHGRGRRSVWGPPLIWAVRRGDLAKVRRTVKFRGPACVNAADEIGSTALHWAVHYDRTAAIRLLVELGADVNRPDKYGSTPIFGVQSLEALRLLIGLLPLPNVRAQGYVALP